MDTTNFTRIVHLSSNAGGRCNHCDFFAEPGRIEDAVNHYLQKHGYKLLHVGTETIPNDHDSTAWHTTVAVLGT